MVPRFEDAQGELQPSEDEAAKMFQKASRGLDLWVDDNIVEHDVWLSPEESDKKKQGDEGGTCPETICN